MWHSGIINKAQNMWHSGIKNKVQSMWHNGISEAILSLNPSTEGLEEEGPKVWLRVKKKDTYE